MLGPADESVGVQFRADLLQEARDKTLLVIREAAAAMRSGHSEDDAKALIQQIQTRLGAERTWHAPQIRFGENTVRAFGEKGVENARLKETDIFFFDIGPVFDAHEGDVGRPFTIGGDPEMQRCCTDAETIWHQVREHWQKTGCTGPELYAFATTRAAALGWQLLLKKANGHRIADFPHAAKARGSIEGFGAPLAADRWILEIQICHPERPIGAFYEDLLN